jgi:hypothetical protein
MLGYTYDDVIKMMAGIHVAKSYLPPNAYNDDVRYELDQAYSLLDGLLEEGHIQ